MDFLFAPLQYAFMTRALLASTIVGVLCAVMGTYVVLRGMAFLGDALAHAILPGVAIAYLLHGNLLVGATVAGLLQTLIGMGAWIAPPYLLWEAWPREEMRKRLSGSP